MRQSGWKQIAIAAAVLSGYFSVASVDDKWKYLGEYGEEEVFVIVESGGGFGGQLRRARLSGSGRFSLIGAYSDSTTVRSTIAADIALTFVDDLLAIDFMGLPEAFRNVRGQIHRNADGSLLMTHTEVVDGGFFRITLHVGSNSHTVTLKLPAYGAPDALRDWMNRFRGLVKEQAGWVAF